MEEKAYQSQNKPKDYKPIVALLIIGVLCIVVPVLLFLLKATPLVMCVASILTAVLLSVSYIILIANPIKKLGKYISTISAGDFGERISIPLGFSDMKSLTAELDVFVNATLNNLMYDLKMEILHTQDTSNEFLTKVQDAVTNSSRISLGADYIRERVVNLQDLADGNAKENGLIRQNISEYR